MLEHLRDHPEIYEFAEENEFEFQLFGLGSWFIPHFVWGTPVDPRVFRKLPNLMKGEALDHYMRYNGVYMPDLHTVFICSEHTDKDAVKVIEAFKKSFTQRKEDGFL